MDQVLYYVIGIGKVSLSHIWFFATPWTVARQALLSVGFCRQECWSGLPCPPPVDPPYLGTEPVSPASLELQADSLPTEPPGKPIKDKWSEVAQLYLTLWDPMNYTIHGILQATVLEWVAVPFSRGFSQPRDRIQVYLHCRQILFCRQILYQLSHKGSPELPLKRVNPLYTPCFQIHSRNKTYL